MISVVVPVYNEERSVALLLDELRSTFEGIGADWEAVFVDDDQYELNCQYTPKAAARLKSACDQMLATLRASVR